MNENDYDWVSVSSLAVQLNVSKQTIYNRCAKGEYPTKTFDRGSMKGLLVGTPKLNAKGYEQIAQGTIKEKLRKGLQ